MSASASHFRAADNGCVSKCRNMAKSRVSGNRNFMLESTLILGPVPLLTKVNIVPKASPMRSAVFFSAQFTREFDKICKVSDVHCGPPSLEDQCKYRIKPQYKMATSAVIRSLPIKTEIKNGRRSSNFGRPMVDVTDCCLSKSVSLSKFHENLSATLQKFRRMTE